MQKRIIILGGAGLIGSHLSKRLLAEGNEIFCVDVREVKNSPMLSSLMNSQNFRYIRHNILNPFGIRCDQIYNLAAPTMVRYDKTLPVESLKVGIIGSINGLDIARSEQARIVFASSGEIYGVGFVDTASQPHYTNSPQQVIAESKRAGEALHRAYHCEFGVDTRIARLFNIYGSGAELLDQRVVIRMVVAALQNQNIYIEGSGEQIRTFCWVEDAVDGLIRLMDAPKSHYTRTLDLGSNHEISISTLAHKIIDLCNSSSKIIHIEARAEQARRRTPNTTMARNELDWQAKTTLSEGLMRTIKYAENELKSLKQEELNWAEKN